MRFVYAFTLWLAACASYADGQWYGAIKTSIAEADIDQISARNIGTGQLINGDIDGALRDDSLVDYTAGVGLAVGRQVGRWVLEGEWVWRYRTDFDNAARTPSIATITNVFADVETHSLTFNLIRRGVINRHWSWEFGTGIGLVSNRVEAEFIERATPTTPEFVLRDDNRSTDLSVSMLAGVVRDLKGPWSLNIRYRYIELGDLDAGPFAGRLAEVSGEFSAHELQFSFERDFSGRY